MEVKTIYENDGEKYPPPSGPWTQSQNRTEAQNRSRNRCSLFITVLLGLICVLLVVGILVLYIHLTAERDLMKRSYMNNAEGYNKTSNNLKMNYSQLTVEKEELKKTLSSVSQKKLELETDNKRLTGEKEELTKSLNSMSQKKQELETDNKRLTDEKEWLTKSLNSMSQTKLELETNIKNLKDSLMKKSGSYMYYISSEIKSWSDSRQFCRDRGQDLVIINTEEEQRHILSIIKEDMWIGLSDIAEEGKMKWVDNTPPYQV
ncbi:uncharacterized protein [Paramisgurnus dabryanus]|uniref:uncharacterized protein n=1 Tax=Paramisgurnus dabryanus TaxID=90735 RepID=UPI0031F4381C